MKLKLNQEKEIQDLELEYMAKKNELALKHREELSQLRKEYKEQEKEITENYDKNMKIIEQNFCNYMSDTKKQNEELLKYLEISSNNLKRRIYKRNIRIKTPGENKLIYCDAIKFEYLPSKIGNIGNNQKINNEENKNVNENNEIENGSLCEKKSEDKK